jgi:glutaminyl-peptide cyclotransferase
MMWARRGLVVAVVVAVAGGAALVISDMLGPIASGRSAASLRASDFDGAAAYALVRRELSFGTRPAGSLALRRLAIVLREMLPDGQFEPIPGSPRLRNIVSVVPGHQPAIVVGAHYDTMSVPGFLGANNGAAATAIVVELARELARTRRPAHAPEIRFVLFDGEEPPHGYPETYEDFYDVALRGSRGDAAAQARTTRAMILLDYVGNRDLVLPREATSTPWLWRLVRDAAFRARTVAVFPRKIGAGVIDDHTPYLRAGVPAVDLIDWSYPGHDPRADTLSAISKDALSNVGATIFVLLRNWSG